MKKFLFCTVLILIISSLNAQNCSSIEEWKKIVYSEFPNINIKRDARLGTMMHKRLMFNLYSDKYFVPFAGKPFDELSDGGRMSRWKRFRVCHQKKKYVGDEFVQWVNNTADSPFSKIRLKEPTKQKVKEARALRNDYNRQLQLIQSGQLSSMELEQLFNSVDNKFGMLFPSELKVIKSVIKQNKSKAANKSVTALISQINSFSNNFTDLDRLGQFKSKNYPFYQNADAESINNVEKVRLQKLNSLLKELVEKERKDFAKPLNIKGFNEFIKQFDSKFAGYKNNESVKKLNQEIIDRKTNHIANNSDDVNRIIKILTTVDQIKKVRAEYLNYVDKSRPTISNLIKNLENQENNIILLAKKERELFNELINRRKGIANGLISESSSLRRVLESKYNTQLPTFEELRNFLYSYLLLAKSSDGKYKVRDAESFIREVERFGYYRKNTENISDYERFIDKNGFTIKALSILETREGISIDFEIDKPSKDIIELYQKDLRGQFRNYNELHINPEKIPTNSDAYVDKGAYFYSMDIESDGSLEVRVMDNLHAYMPVVAEKIGINKISVTPWTTKTHIYLKKGQKIKLETSGYIKLGVFSVDCYANGIEGFRWNNLDSNFKHGSLIGKIGKNSNWEYVGPSNVIVAKQEGYLELVVNDQIPGDNSGAFKVEYKFIN